MQAIIALPPFPDVQRLDVRICGVPLLVRVVSTALRAGITRILLLYPPGFPYKRQRELVSSLAANRAAVESVHVSEPFDPSSSAHWLAIEDYLDDQFVWMPCDYIVHKAALTEMLATAAKDPDSGVKFGDVLPAYSQPLVLLKSALTAPDKAQFQTVSCTTTPGISMNPPVTVKDAEKELVRRSGKAGDGIHSRLNRRLCWPAVRWLSHTRVSANAVSFFGLVVAIFAALCFARGTWAFDAAGGALFFVSGLFDEMDGMLARLKFRESAFGTWLETWIDYSTYVLIFAGMTAGAWHRGGTVFLWIGAAVIFGCLLSFALVTWQRTFAPSVAPADYYRHYLKKLDGDARNPISLGVRKLHFLTRKGVLVYYVLLFAILDGAPVVLVLSAIGANVSWLVTLYFNRRFFLPRSSTQRRASRAHLLTAEVKK